MLFASCYSLFAELIIFLYGADGYRLKQDCQKIIDEYRKKHAVGDFAVLDFSEGTSAKTAQFEDALKTVSFFDEKKLIQASGTFAAAEDVARIIKNRGLAEDKGVILILIENLSETDLIKKDKKLFNLLLAKPNMSKSFEPLGGKRLDDWIIKEAGVADIAIDTSTARKLASIAGNNSWALKQEIDKLTNYCLANGRRKITGADIDLLVPAKISQNIFETIDALAAGSRGRAALLLSRHLADGEDPYYLFSMIVYQFRNLLRVKDLTLQNSPSANLGGLATVIARKTGLHPFVARKAAEQARKFELEELKQKFTRLADYDVAIKNGEIDIVDCLYQIALS